jgi:hypothetical protein
LNAYSTNCYTCRIQYTDGSTSNVTDLTAWSLIGDAHGAVLNGNALSVGDVASDATVTVQATHNEVTNTYSVLLNAIPYGVLAKWDFYGLSSFPTPSVATATAYTVSSAPVVSRVGLTSSGSTNHFIAQFPTNRILAEVTNKYFSFSLSNATPITVADVSMCIRRLGSSAPTNFTLRVSSDAEFSTYTDRQINSGQFVYYNNWTASNLNVSGTAVYFRLYGYGAITSSYSAGFAGTTNSGTTPANSGLDGTMYDLIVYGQQADADSDRDSIPDSWEQRYFGGSTNANPGALCSNGINTIFEGYIAGLDPANPQNVFKIPEFRLAGTDKILRWTTVSGRVYSVYWTSNLLTGFQCLESNIPWTQDSFTNSTNVPCGYYKIGVQLP